MRVAHFFSAYFFVLRSKKWLLQVLQVLHTENQSVTFSALFDFFLQISTKPQKTPIFLQISINSTRFIICRKYKVFIFNYL